MRRFVTAAVIGSLAFALTGCGTQSVDPSVDQAVTAESYSAVVAGWQQIVEDAKGACQGQLMGADVTPAASKFTAAVTAYQAAWARLDRTGTSGPRLPRSVPVPTAGAGWCSISNGLTPHQ